MKRQMLSFVFVMFLLLTVNFVEAEGPPHVSEAGVEYDAELDGQFLLNEWVFVTVRIKDTSNIATPLRDSPDFESKIDERKKFISEISDSVLATLSEKEFQLDGKLTGGSGFYGNITREGFDKLLNDTRVRKIYAEKIFRDALSGSAPLINADDADGFGYMGVNYYAADVNPAIDPKIEEALQNQVEVLVFFKPRFNETDWESRSLDSKQAEAKSLQDEVIPSLENAGVKSISRFQLSPFISGYLSKESLDKLRSDPNIERIDLIGETHTLLDEYNRSRENNLKIKFFFIISLVLLLIVLFAFLKINRRGAGK